MSGSGWLAILALLLGALAILPGTLGILMLTNRVAATSGGARLIYEYSRILLWVSVVTMIIAWAQAIGADHYPTILIGVTVAYIGVLAFGFLMHTGLMFQPVEKPTFIPVSEALQTFDPSEEIVGVVDPAGNPYAFIAVLARRPHIVQHTDGEVPFMMTHCILSHSSMAYEHSGAFADPAIRITAAIANNMVFYDRRNRCSFTQLHNASEDGALQLKPLPSLMMSLGTWAQLYPDSKVWVRRKIWRDMFYLKVLSRADVVDPSSPVLIYPLMHGKDDRLALKSLVLGVEVDGHERAYPLPVLQSEPVINDTLGSASLLLVSAFEGDYAQVFSREVQPGEALTFQSGPEAGLLVDAQTGSVWNIRGECEKGQHKGHQLAPIPHYNKIFWFAWADYHPGTDVYAPTPEPAAQHDESS